MMTQSEIYIDIATSAPEGTEAFIRTAAEAVAREKQPEQAANKAWACTFRVADDAEVRELNKNFRGKDKPTNVLSFPADADMQEPDAPYYLGDIVFGLETVQAEAQAQKKTFEDHLKHLAIHGLLHLYGYDHIHDAEADVMETLEINILKALNISNPYNDES